MNRKWTNRIRFLMDECIPPIIRDQRWFMYPFFYYAYRGRRISDAMDFKKKYFEWNQKELEDFYKKIKTISSDRKTDISPAGLQAIIKECGAPVQSVLDVGCGKGFLLQTLQRNYPSLTLHGIDFVEQGPLHGIGFTQSDARRIPFEDSSFDVVVCTHTIEHIYKGEELVKELKRIARKKVIIITPRQRYFYYTLDEHVSFFPQKELLTALINIDKHLCTNIEGDWFYVGFP